MKRKGFFLFFLSSCTGLHASLLTKRLLLCCFVLFCFHRHFFLVWNWVESESSGGWLVGGGDRQKGLLKGGEKRDVCGVKWWLSSFFLIIEKQGENDLYPAIGCMYVCKDPSECPLPFVRGDVRKEVSNISLPPQHAYIYLSVYLSRE